MSEDSQFGTAKQWFQDNLRIIISVLIVVVIAGGIYSYSKRSEAPTQQAADEQQENILEKIAGTEDNKGQEAPAATQNEQKDQNQTATNAPVNQKNTSSVSTSQETENSFIETAARGDSQTRLARRALANYLEKNSDSALTPEHKIYIEDYLRKHVANKGKIRVGTSVEFSKSLIQEAISSSKKLNDKQLQNLHKYAVRVPSLS